MSIEPKQMRAGPAGLHTSIVLPELVEARARDLKILILADGNRRHAPSGGYEGGARKVVSIAEHLARRGDVAALVACVLSPENVAKRSDGFFLDLYRQFVRLGVAIANAGAIVSSGVRIEIWGDLETLRDRGGHAEALAYAMEAVAAMTARDGRPAMRLVLAVGYGSDAARALDVDVVMRTGMEEEGVLRLSGLDTLARIASHATTRLWPDLDPREVDDVIDLAKRRALPGFAGGYTADAIADLAISLSAIDPAARARVIIPSVSSARATADALDRLFAGPLRESAQVAVEHARDDRAQPDRHGAGCGARWELRVVHGARALDAASSVLAPGQRPPFFTLPDWLELGHANVHGCDAGAPAIAEGLRAALRFADQHPALLGGDRPTAPRAPDVSQHRAGAPERDALGDAFAAKIFDWAASAGLLLPSAAWQTAALNYALTGFFMHLRVPTEWDETAADWEARAELSARYMLIISAGDEGIFDRAIEGETAAQRLDRLSTSARFLMDAVRGDGSRAAPPDVPGAALLAAIARALGALRDRYGDACHPDVLESWLAGVDRLYTGSVAEHRGDLRSASSILNDHLVRAPSCVIARARGGAGDELRVLRYLAEASGAIGAGLLFRTAALAAPASCVTPARVAILDVATALLDYPFRLSNDMSGFIDTPGGDRDPKVNACAILVPASASGAARAAAVVDALATCGRLAAWLDGEARDAIDRVAEAWPSMGAALRRGVFVGRRVYEVGHYASLGRAQMSAIFDEAERALAR